MPGPAPKRPENRQRRNRTSVNATLPTEASSAANKVPELPPRPDGWHPMVQGWWADVWRSPMASEYLEADKRGLYRLATLEQDFWTAESPSMRMSVSAEIRQVSLPFGLTPIDRRRLQWEVEKGETAALRTESRRRTVKQPSAGKDPRDVLRLA